MSRFSVRTIRSRSANGPDSLVAIVDGETGKDVETMTGKVPALALARHMESCTDVRCRRCPRSVRASR